MYYKGHELELTCRPIAAGEGIANKTLIAYADWHMIPNAAVGIDSAQARAWVLALSINASLVGGTI